MAIGMSDDQFWSEVRQALPSVLPDFFRRQRWFGGKAEAIASVEVIESLRLPWAEARACLFLVNVTYRSAATQVYALPLLAHDARFGASSEDSELSLPVQLGPGRSSPITVSDAMRNPHFGSFLLGLIREARRLTGIAGELRSTPAPTLASILEQAGGPIEPSLMGVEQSNSSIRYGERLILKFFRRLEHGLNLDLEMGRFLTETVGFRHVPQSAGFIEYSSAVKTTATLALLQGFVPNRGDAWRYTLYLLEQYLDRLRAVQQLPPLPATPANLLELANVDIPQAARALLGEIVPFAELLGTRTAELHLALGSGLGGPDFAPESFPAGYRVKLADAALQLAADSLRLLDRRRESLPSSERAQAGAVLGAEEEISSRLRAMRSAPMTAARTRIHGDYHLGQVLYTGSDFVIIDFEGEPERPLAERREKRSPFYDVAGMLRSFHYAVYSALRQEPREAASADGRLQPWARLWNRYVSGVFLGSYLRKAGTACFIPQSREEIGALLDFHLLEKAVYEIGYELKNRPGWVSIPLSGILDILGLA